MTKPVQHKKKLQKQSHETRDNIYELLRELYGTKIASDILPKFDLLLTENIEQRNRTISQADAVLITYADTIQEQGQTNLQAIHRFANHHFNDLISDIHFLPFYPWTSDEGFGVSDYMNVDPKNGTWVDMKAISKDFGLVFDLVFNHVSGSHPWFKKCLDGDPRYKNYFIELPPDTDISSVNRCRATPLLTPFETETGTKYYWTTFGPDQLDLNYAEPELLIDMLKVAIHYVRQGADALRLDSANFIWKELGTSCSNHPNAHKIVQIFRAVLQEVAPWVRLLTETNVSHEENAAYFGDGNNEAHMVYNFALPMLTIEAILNGDARILSNWAKDLSTPSSNTYYFNFLATHDGIYINAVREIFADKLPEIFDVVKQHGGRLSNKATPEGEMVYELNTTLFSLLNHEDDDTDTSVSRFMCVQAIQFALAGIPGIYINSMLASINWAEGIEIGRANGDSEMYANRRINRQKFYAEDLEAELADPSSRRYQAFDRLSKFLHVRRSEPAFHPNASQKVLSLHPSIFALERISLDGTSRVLAIHNVSDQKIELQLPTGYWQDMVGETYRQKSILLHPYAAVWLKKTPQLKKMLKYVSPKIRIRKSATSG